MLHTKNQRTDESGSSVRVSKQWERCATGVGRGRQWTHMEDGEGREGGRGENNLCFIY